MVENVLIRRSQKLILSVDSFQKPNIYLISRRRRLKNLRLADRLTHLAESA
jgi:hypothetical protein